jgi:subtilisin family serine protease
MKRTLARLAVVTAAAAVVSAAIAASATAATYIVLYKQAALPAGATATIENAGGTLVFAYPQIGVLVARSSNPAFRDVLLRDSRIENASATDAFGIQIHEDILEAEGPPPGDLPNAPAGDADNLSALQWDMRQIDTPAAHAITGGSRAVIAGDLDTGLDFTHPDLAPNYDAANSANCESGAPTPLLPGNDQNGHGTHTAGTIAAASNGVGIVGVAPNVSLASVKTSNDAGYFFPEMVVCAFMWAGSHHFDVTNNSYFADPFLFNCHNDPAQQAIWKAEYRAIRYAQTQGTTVVAALGNFSDDLAHPTQDVTSPDNTTPETRTIHNNCVVIPAEVPGVIGVSADGNLRLKSFYSNYGVGVTEVTAPGGDSVLQRTPEAPNGRVLSSWPLAAIANCAASRRVFDVTAPTGLWCYQQGTSMASPHVAGVAALVVSRFGDAKNPQNGKMRPEQVAAIIQQTATPLDCPPPDILALYAPFPSASNGAPQTCQGGMGNNSWYGKGEVDALAAITHMPNNG